VANEVKAPITPDFFRTPETTITPAPAFPVAAQPKVEFSEVQRQKIEEIVARAQGRAAKGTRDILAAKLAEIERLQEELRAVKEAASAKPKEDDPEVVADLQKEIEELTAGNSLSVTEKEGLSKQTSASLAKADAAEQILLTERKRNLILKEANAASFLAPDVTRVLTEKNIKWDSVDDRWVVTNDDGKPRISASGEPMTVPEFFAEFAMENPFLVKTSAKLNGQLRVAPPQPKQYTVEQIFGHRSSGRDANLLAQTNPTEYKRLRAEAVKRGIL